MKKQIIYLLAAATLAGSSAFAQSSGESLQQALYAEQIEGDLPSAIAQYQTVIDNSAAPTNHVAQALYHQAVCLMTLKQEERAAIALTRLCSEYPDQTDLVEKAKPMLESIQVFDPAALMPPETLAYLELGSTGCQLETILEMLKGTPLEDPLLMISQMDPDALREGPGPLIAGLLNPAMKEDLTKIRGLAVGVVDITQQAPSMVGVLHLGDSTMLRGLLMTGLSMVTRPGPVVEGVQTYSMQGGPIDIACDDQVFMFSFPNGQLPWMIRQYKHRSSDASLASSNPSFQQLDKDARRQNLATLWVNTDDAYSRLVQLNNNPQIGMAGAVVNVASIDDLMLTASIAADTIGIDGRLRFKGQNMIYEMIKTPAISRAGMKGVPADAVGLLSFDLADSSSMQAAQLRQLALANLGMDLPADLMDSMQQMTLFALPYNDIVEQADAEIPVHLGVMIRCQDMTPVRPFVEKMKPMLAEQDIVVEAVDGAVILSVLDSTAIDAVTAALQGGAGAADAGVLNAAIKQYADSSEKLALINIGELVRLAGVDNLYVQPHPIVTEEMNRQLADGYEALAAVLDGTALSIHTEEESDEFVLQIRLNDIPEVTNIVAAARKVVEAEAQVDQKIAQQRAEAQRKAEEELRKELAEQWAKLVPAEVPHTAAAPVLDGDLDALWNQAPVYAVDKVNTGINEREQGEPIDGSEFGADFRMLWDEQNLYVFMNVTDSTLNRNPEIGWQFSDNIILYIDATDAKLGHFGPTDYEYAFCWDAEQPQVCEPKRGKMTNVRYRVKTTDKGYVVEAAFPWETLGTPNPAAGTVIGIDVQASDNQAGPKRNLMLGWQDDQNRAWMMPGTFGRAVLK